MRYLRDLKDKKLVGKICLFRADFNVKGKHDSFKLKAVIPSIRFLLKKGVRVVILSHKGRPLNDGKTGLSLNSFIPFLKNELGIKPVFLKNVPIKLPVGNLFLMENLRFWPEEEKNDFNFAKKLARFADFYVNDAFAVSHRENASVTQLPKFLPSYAGFVLEREIKILSGIMKNPKKPLVLVFGGAKVKDKIPAIKNLLPKADLVLLGSSVFQSPDFELQSKKILKPIDWISEGGRALDIGPLTIELYKEAIRKAKTVIWNGPLGLIEDKRFALGSIEIAKVITESAAFSVVGGGETTQLILGLGLEKKIDFLSTGGGAMLEFLAGKKLPGIYALDKSRVKFK